MGIGPGPLEEMAMDGGMIDWGYCKDAGFPFFTQEREERRKMNYEDEGCPIGPLDASGQFRGGCTGLN